MKKTLVVIIAFLAFIGLFYGAVRTVTNAPADPVAETSTPNTTIFISAMIEKFNEEIIDRETRDYFETNDTMIIQIDMNGEAIAFMDQRGKWTIKSGYNWFDVQRVLYLTLGGSFMRYEKKETE